MVAEVSYAHRLFVFGNHAIRRETVYLFSIALIVSRAAFAHRYLKRIFRSAICTKTGAFVEISFSVGIRY